MGKMEIKKSLKHLVGTLDIGKLDVDKFTKECAEMKALGYYGVYFNDIFFTIENTDYTCPDGDILFREDKCLIVRRSQNELAQIKNILQKYDLKTPSAHFPAVLPSPGADLESIYGTHEKILNMALFMELKRVTTHVGHIAVPVDSTLFPGELHSGKLNYTEYCEQLKNLLWEG